MVTNDPLDLILTIYPRLAHYDAPIASGKAGSSRKYLKKLLIWWFKNGSDEGTWVPTKMTPSGSLINHS